MIAALFTIAVLHWAVLLVPGLNFVLIGQLAAGGSRRAALAAVVGMTTGTLMWALLAVAGVGALFSAHPVLRQVAQVAGGMYLLVLARNLWRSGRVAPSAPDRVQSALAAFRAGFFTSLLNPKIALFYGSVFATALPADPPARMVAASVALVYANSWVWHGALALALSSPGVQNAYSARYRALTRGSAVLVGAFGLRLLVTALQDWAARLP